jgi:phosphoribosylanthranilate isomerase
MTWIKICGITNLEDALATADAGANAVGFSTKKLRNIDLQTAKSIVAKLPPRLDKVGVFVHGTNRRLRKLRSKSA